MDSLRFLNPDQVRQIAKIFGTPVFVYDEKTLMNAAKSALSFPNRHGLTVRYAMKASPNRAILKLFDQMGLSIDASSGYEAERAIRAGISAHKIQITAQELPENLLELVSQGVSFNACSLHQLESFGRLFPRTKVSIRINPGLGSGHSNRTNVGGLSSSFGIWWEQIPELKQCAKKFGLTIHKLHTHIGSGADPEIWKKVARMSLAMAQEFESVTSLNLGGGFKVARMDGEKQTDLHAAGSAVLEAFEDFYRVTGRPLALEIEPGTYLVALAACVITQVIDKVNTGKEGYTFLKVNSGMTEVTRPSLYGAQHPLILVPKEDRKKLDIENVLVAGHCCESGDLLTPEPGNPEGLLPRTMIAATIGDYLVIEGAGAYCSGMSTKNYNSFPEATEILWEQNEQARLIRKRQTLEQITQNESPYVS